MLNPITDFENFPKKVFSRLIILKSIYQCNSISVTFTESNAIITTNSFYKKHNVVNFTETVFFYSASIPDSFNKFPV